MYVETCEGGGGGCICRDFWVGGGGCICIDLWGGKGVYAERKKIYIELPPPLFSLAAPKKNKILYFLNIEVFCFFFFLVYVLQKSYIS